VAVSRLPGWLLALVLLRFLRRRRPPEPPREPLVPPGTKEPGAELAVIVLLFASAALALAFLVDYALDSLSHQTQWLGATLGLSLLCTAAALILTGKRLVVTEELEEEYPPREHEEEQEAVVRLIEDSGSRITRRRLLATGLAVSGGSLGLALLAPAASLGPVLDMESYYSTPWRRGTRLVDEQGRPYRASDIETDTMYTAFAEHADREDPAASLVLVRLAPAELELPEANRGYAADGIVAYSKTCTHAACAISLYRTPLFAPLEPKPALVCPCHYSTFDPATGGTVLFGPAGRKLPMLPLSRDRRGLLRAAGSFDEPVGASWWGVRRRRPS
jgi:ubiquinol-cytochrome c reductase iron-sulfur subunit